MACTTTCGCDFAGVIKDRGLCKFHCVSRSVIPLTWSCHGVGVGTREGGGAVKVRAYAVLAAPSMPKRMAPGSLSTVGGLKAV